MFKVSFEDAFLKKRGLSLGAESDLNADNQIFGQLALWCVDLNDGKKFTTMEWLMVFVKVPL